MEKFQFQMRCAGTLLIGIIGVVVLFSSWSIETHSAVHQIYAQLVSLTGVVIIGVSIICDALLHIEGKICKCLDEITSQNNSDTSNKENTQQQ